MRDLHLEFSSLFSLAVHVPVFLQNPSSTCCIPASVLSFYFCTNVLFQLNNIGAFRPFCFFSPTVPHIVLET